MVSRPQLEQEGQGGRRMQLAIFTGLFLTFGSLVAYALQLPTSVAALDRVLPWLAIGFVCCWVGGILAGNSVRDPPPGVPPALRGQPALAALATAAGVLSAGVVLQRIGPWVPPSPGLPVELVVAITAGVLAWVGGSLMGMGMHRFIRRRRRPRSTVAV